jgi:multiple sugar transport system permease protein
MLLPAYRARLRTASTRLAVLSALALATWWMLFPFIWAILASIKRGGDTYGDQWLPWVSFEPTLQAWRRLFARPDLGPAFANSVVLSTGAATLAVAFGVPAAYGVSRFAYPRRWQAALIGWFVVQRVLPPVVLLAPYVLLARLLGLLDSVVALVLVNTTLHLPLVVVILSGAFRELPFELEQAAWLDGASRWESFARVGVPLALPAIAASWLLCLAFSWNEWMFAAALSYTEARSMPVLIQATGGGGGVNMQAATSRALTAMAVPLLTAILAQRAIVRGLSLGALKG